MTDPHDPDEWARSADDDRLRRLVAEEASRQATRRAEERARRRSGRGRLYGMVASVALLVVVSAWAMGRADPGPRYLDPITGEVSTEANAPTPQPAVRAVPLGTPPQVRPGGTTAFVASAGGAPVAYDPCRAVAVVINERTMPASARGIVQAAIDEVGTATGLVFEVEGLVDEPPVERRDPFQPERYGDRWAPVLVAWSDPAELPALAGPVAGFGGSNRLDRSDQPAVYVTGQVVLDGPQLAQAIDQGGPAAARAIVLHELGHLVGLDHVDDRDELLHPENRGEVLGFGPGDRWGLAQLGRGPCVPLV